MASDTDIAKPDPSLDFGEAREELSEGTGSPPPLDSDVPEAAPAPLDPAKSKGNQQSAWRRLRFLRPLSSLTQRIVAINLVGLAVLVAGVLFLNQLRTELVQVRVNSLVTQGTIVATAIAELAAVSPEATRYDAYAANEVLRQLTLPTGQRAQLYTRGRLTGDTRSFDFARTPVETETLAPPSQGSGGFLGWVEGAYSRLAKVFFADDLPLYIETPVAGITEDAEVYKAARGEVSSALRLNSDGELIVSVAVPIQRLKVVMGVLVLSTEGGDIDRVIRVGRIEILRVVIVAGLVSLLLAFLLARGIARPLRKLAVAAEAAGVQEDMQIHPDRIEIPDYTDRADEIGDLSGALRRMTDALYSRIDAIESFAADVAHEIKNPLTSLRSAVETMSLAKTDASRARLMEVIQDDVTRMDRLVTDISNASRLDAELVREKRAPFDLGALVETMADISSAAEHGVTLTTAVPPTSLMVRGLESRIGQVLANLIENAVSFSEPKSRIRLTAGRSDDGSAWVTVEDEGPGIPPDNLESIFQRFYTERPAEEAFGRHSGLGLSISKQIVEAHGGTIKAENIGDNDAPDGARFILRLPQ
jgi:two-component system sensor histidine kinase ChvG